MARSGRGGGGKLGTFGGVFTPSLLTIPRADPLPSRGLRGRQRRSGPRATYPGPGDRDLGVHQRSLAAIATNRKVRGGGDYYLISRSLGVEYGGALGLLLFAAQAVSVAFYCVGFGEGVAGVLGTDSHAVVSAAAAVAAAALLALAYLGADVATRFQYLIMAILAGALAAFFGGSAGAFRIEQMLENWRAPEETLGFWPLFAIFFPAVTGFTQGVSMSGDLRDPARSLPQGTFLAVGISTVVYAAVIVLLAGNLPASELARDYGAMRRLAWPSALIDAGILSATLSSALASFLGAPRILQALARDGIFARLRFFARGEGESQNPRRAVLLTAAIAFTTIAFGNLNAIAGVVSMFFLISYGLLNYATYVEATAASPSFPAALPLLSCAREPARDPALREHHARDRSRGERDRGRDPGDRLPVRAPHGAPSCRPGARDPCAPTRCWPTGSSCGRSRLASGRSSGSGAC
jgi:hypothetical protein